MGRYVLTVSTLHLRRAQLRDEDAQLENQGDSKVGKLLLKHLYDQEAELSPRSGDKLGFFQ